MIDKIETETVLLLPELTRSEADRAALIGRPVLRADGAWLAELLTDLRSMRLGYMSGGIPARYRIEKPPTLSRPMVD